jgi:ribosome maturation factor RimP
LDDLELSGRGHGRVLRVIVDGDDLNVDRLAELSCGLSRLLDDEPALQDSYRLEVSSPGLERKLRRPSHYRKSLGREVVVKATVANHKTTYRGTLADVGDNTFTVETEQGTEEISYDDVISAQTIFRWERAPKPGH